MSFVKEGKRKLVELKRGDSTFNKNAPENINIFRVNSICKENDDFCYIGTVNNRKCNCKIDTDSEISIINIGGTNKF